MLGIQTKWALDILCMMSKDFERVLGIPLVVSKCRESSVDDLRDLNSCVESCIKTKDDSDYLMMIFSDYEKYFGTKAYIPEPDGDKKIILRIINESYRIDCDLLSLYYKGVKLVTLDYISIDLAGNDVNLVGYSDSEELFPDFE